MIRHKYVIVVGIDYSTSSERALDEALELASSKRGVQLHVANVRPPFTPEVESNGAPAPRPPWSYWATELREYVARKLAAYQATAGVPPFQHVYTHQRMNDPAHELAQLAADVEADLLVVGTHDWRAASPLALGSVAEAVSRLAPCPVLVVRRKAVPPAIQPPCAACIAARHASNEANLWCERHGEHRDHRHSFSRLSA